MIGATIAAAVLFSGNDVHDIRLQCRVPASWLHIRRDGVHLAPSKNVDLHRVDCILAAMKATAIEHGYTPVELVGNEAP